MTKEEIRKYIYYQKSFKNFCKLCVIYDVLKGEYSNIQLFPFQKKLVSKIDKENYIAINSCRQMGITAILSFYALYQAQKMKKVLFITHTMTCVDNALDRIDHIINCNQTFFGTTRRIGKRIEFSNGGYIQMCIPSHNAGKGECMDLVIIDNAAYVKELNNILVAASLLISATRGKIILASSPFRESYFNKLCQNIKNESRSCYKLIELPWYINEAYSMNKIKMPIENKLDGEKSKYWNEWYQHQRDNFSNDVIKINEEMNCSLTEQEPIKRITKSDRVNLRLSKTMVTKLEAIAIKNEQNVSQLIRHIIEDYFIKLKE